MQIGYTLRLGRDSKYVFNVAARFNKSFGSGMR
jgi:hypothetical protein